MNGMRLNGFPLVMMKKKTPCDVHTLPSDGIGLKVSFDSPKHQSTLL
jgi:hypothetical protein